MTALLFLLLLICLGVATATPVSPDASKVQPLDRATTPTPTKSKPGLSQASILSSQLASALAGVKKDPAPLNSFISAFPSAVQQVVPTSSPTSFSELQALLKNDIYNPATPINVYQAAIDFFLNTLLPQNIAADIIGFTGLSNNPFNINPPVTLAPAPNDPAFTYPEAFLQQHMFIPPGFGENGNKPTILLVPGTGAFGGLSFESNFIKLLQLDGRWDLAWLNLPDAELGDMQGTSESIVYATRYLSARKNNSKINVITHSDGGLTTQWALKFFPSTRSLVENFVALSPDFKGTTNEALRTLAFPYIPCDPGTLQQGTETAFIHTLGKENGWSAYVPTTTVYTSFYDEVVQPEIGTVASSYLSDVRNMGVTNNPVQQVCPGQPAGSYYGHIGILYNPVSYALAIDALTHDGPGQMSRLNLPTVCALFFTQNLTLGDIIAAEGAMVANVINTAIYEPKVFVEPPLKPYALLPPRP